MESSKALQTWAQVLKKYPSRGTDFERVNEEGNENIVFLGRVAKDGGECCGLSMEGCFRAVIDTLGTNSQMCLSDRAPEGQDACLTSFSCYKQKPSQPLLSSQQWRTYRKDTGWCREAREARPLSWELVENMECQLPEMWAFWGVTCLSHLCPDCLLPSADQICLLWSENQRLWSLIKMSECLQLKINEIYIVSSRFLPCFLGFLDNCLHSVPLPSSKSSPDLFSKHQPIDSFLNVPQIPGLSQSSSP